MGAVAKKSHLWERDPLDWYVEPESVTDALLTVERFPEPIWDPACGQGNIVRALRRAGLNAVGSDLVARNGQRAIVRAPKGGKNKAWAELRACTTELLRQHVEAA